MGRDRREGQVAHRTVAIGLTGGIGAGKSTALCLFADLGAETVSADGLVHDLYERPSVAEAISEHFGAQVLSDEGVVDRRLLAEAVRGRPDELGWLEDLTHPLVAQMVAERVEAASECSVVVCEVPLLFEAGYERLFDVVVTIEAELETRRRRSTHDFGLDQFSEFENLQATGERRRDGSDFAFVNDGGLEALREFVGSVYQSAWARLRRSGCEDGS